MTEVCRLCNSPVEANDDIEQLNRVSWDSVEAVEVGSTWTSPFAFTAVPTVKVVAKHLGPDYEDQGREDESIWIVVEYNGKFFKKLGTVDSYGYREWDGYIREVRPTEKTITVYEF